MASPRDEMETEEEFPSPSSTPTPRHGRRKGEGKDDRDEISKQLNELVEECLRADGLKADNPIRAKIETFESDRYSEAEYTMTSMLVSLAHQVQTLTVTVQNLSRTVQELQTEGAPPKNPGNQRTEPPKTYAKAAAQAPQNAKSTPAKGKRKAEVGPTPPKQPTTKQAKKTQEPPADNQPKGKIPGREKTKSTNVARRKLFATRTVAKPLADTAGDEAKISLAVATVLNGCECKAPTNLQVFSNKTNGTITLTAPPGNDSGQYAKYIDKITEALNSAIGSDEPKYLPFRRAPTDVDVIIHGVSLSAIPNNTKDLEEEVKQTFRVTHRIEVAGAKFLKPNEEDRKDKKATSIIVRIPETEVDKVTPSVLFMGKYKKSAVMWQASATTQCHKCWKFGHPIAGCKAQGEVCPICSGAHTQKEHKCHQTGCKGHKRIIPNCCLMTPAKCPACGLGHSALDTDCPEKLRVKEAAKEKYDLRMASLATKERATQPPHN